MKRSKMFWYIILSFAFFWVVAGDGEAYSDKSEYTLLEVAKTRYRWTGIAVSREDRIFVNFPRWSMDVPVSVAEVKDGKIIPYPNNAFNDPKTGFDCVQSVYVDRNDHLWILETSNPLFQGVKEVGPILYQFDLSSDQMLHKFTFDKNVYSKNSYFNDVRIDEKGKVAYITDSGVGALISLNLKTKKSRRHLADHPSTKAERDYLIINGKKWTNRVHSDGIALSPDRRHLYYTPLTGDHLFRIATQKLLDDNLTEAQLGEYVEMVMKVGAPDGMLFDDKGYLFLAGLENHSIKRFRYPDQLEVLIKDDRIKWADSFARDSMGDIYFTTSQIHLTETERDDYMIYKLEKRK